MATAMGDEIAATRDIEMLYEEFNRLHPTVKVPIPKPAGKNDKALPAMEGPPELYEDFFQQVHALDGDGRMALCLSGGGIRSAAFNLGVLQALAATGLLDKFHYLSTVSGGGYIGCWLALWRRREGLSAVLKGLGWPGLDEPSSDHEGIVAPDAIRSLRGKTSYLAPRMGLLSSDTWTAIVLYLRNLLLNLLILLPVLAALVLLPKVILLSTELMLDRHELVAIFESALFGLMILVWIAGWTLLALARPAWRPANMPRDEDRSGADRERDAENPSRRSAQRGSGVILVASGLYGIFVVCWVERTSAAGYLATLATGGAYGLVTGAAAFLAALVSGLSGRLQRRSRARLRRRDINRAPTLRDIMAEAWQDLRKAWKLSGYVRRAAGKGDVLRQTKKRAAALMSDLASLWTRTALVWIGASISGVGVGVFLAVGLLIARHFWWYDDNRLLWIFSLAPLWFIFGHLVGDSLYLGLTARRRKDPRQQARDPWGDLEREWLARSGGLMLTCIGVATGFLLFDAFAGRIWGFAEAAPWQGYYTAVTGAVSFGGSVLLGFSSLTGGNRGQDKQSRAPFQAILLFATPVFALILVSGISRLADAALYSADFVEAWAPCTVTVGCRPIGLSVPPARASADLAALAIELVGALMLLALGWGASRFININRFSLHDLYRLRLMREFLGASNTEHERQADGWTGFTDADDDDLASLWSPKEPEGSEAWKPCLYPVINTTLNLVETNRLAWQERKGEPFAFTPDYVGSVRLGYRPTNVSAGGVRISSAMTISGAAVSPDAGYSTVPGLSLLMTMFNLRLGAWVGNPHNGDTYRRRGPRGALKPLLVEAFAATTERDATDYVYLSDGGHFDNLGLYEMLRRRCRYIVASDAGCDPDYAFGDLGRVVRQVSIDMGIRVTFQQLSMAKRPEPGAQSTATDQAYFAVATIEYPERITINRKEGPALGYLVYIKPGFQNRTEPADVRAFAATNPAFPHDSTINQFFGESQFESYRSLGRHIVRDLIGPPGQAASPLLLSSAFRRARVRLKAAATVPTAAKAARSRPGARRRFGLPS